MIFIPGFLIALVTFPGVIVHEAAHQFFCKRNGLGVLEVCYFRIGNPAGYVIHETTAAFRPMWMVAMGPFFVNTTLCVLFCSAAFIPIGMLGVDDPLAILFMWLGISIGMHAIPSGQDMQGIWRLMPSEARARNPLALVSYPIVALVFLFNLLRIFWADAIYAVLIGVAAPWLLFKALI
jgi:hypothetical protein